MKEKTTWNFVASNKPRDMLLQLYENRDQNNYVSKIAFKTRTTYSHSVNVFKKLEKMGLIEKKNEGRRERPLALTEKGLFVARKLFEIKKYLGGYNENKDL